MVRTTFKLSFMCDNSLPLWVNIKTGWAWAWKTNRQPLDFDYRFGQIGIWLQRENHTLLRNHNGFFMRAYVCVICLSIYMCVFLCVYLADECVSTSIKTPIWAQLPHTEGNCPEIEMNTHLTFVSVSKRILPLFNQSHWSGGLPHGAP